MAIHITKYVRYVPWDDSGVGASRRGSANSLNRTVDLSQYYTKIDLQTAGLAQVHFDNITDAYHNNLLGLQGGKVITDSSGTPSSEGDDEFYHLDEETYTRVVTWEFLDSLIEESDGTIHLINDEDVPGPGKYYGTDLLGVKGWLDLPEGGGIVDVTYAELVALMDSSGDGLVAGQFYRITDFATVHYMVDNVTATADINTGSTEPLIVLAISESALDSRAYSELYPYDVIHYDWNPANWLTDVSFGGNDETLVTGFKGVIYFRHDTLHDNYMGYDFRNVKFRRWNNGSEIGDVYVSEYQAWSSTADGVTDPEDYIDVLTFNCPGGEEQYNFEVRSVHIEPFKDQTDLYRYNPTILNNNVFHLVAPTGFYQVFTTFIGFFCICNTFNGYIVANAIGNGFGYNTIGKGFNANTIGNYFYSNAIGNGFYSNTIGSNFYSNTIGNTFISNTIGNFFYSNTIGNGFYSNTIGNTFYSNTIGDSCQNITAENNVNHITLADNSTNIRIGNSSSYIELGDSSGGVTNIDIGQGCGGDGKDIVIGGGSYAISFGSNCSAIVVGAESYANTFNHDCYLITLPMKSQNNNFLEACTGKDFTNSSVDEITNGSNIIHRMCGTKIVGTYLEEQSDGSFVEVHAENIIGVNV